MQLQQQSCAAFCAVMQALNAYRSCIPCHKGGMVWQVNHSILGLAKFF